MKKRDYLTLLLMMLSILGLYHLIMQAKFYDLRGIRTPQDCERIDQVIIYPNRESIAIICEVRR